jgi:periplasmic nitrate reductase NapD
MAEVPRELHISSAVVSAIPQHVQAVASAIAGLPDTEVHHVAGGKIVIVMEGPSVSVIGGRLTQIALMDHVLSANLVYEVIETEGSGEACHGTQQT